MLLPAMSARAMAVAPRRAPDPSRRKAVAWGAMATSKCGLSNRIDVAAKVTRSLNCVVRVPTSTALDNESNATLYSVRPHHKEFPSGVYFTAEGIVKLDVVYEYK